ncbi:MAG: hypothetical protein H6704_04705 [Myxococcales bacterium]|nr:hypothetical protein [Myxococcales bacterium]
MPHRALSLLTALPLLLAPLFAQATPKLSGDAKATLTKGEVIVERLDPTGGTGVAARAMGVVDAAPAKVWPVVRDCEHFAKFMPRTKMSALISRKGTDSVCKVEIEMPFPFDNLWSVVRSSERETEGGGFQRVWTLMKGTYKRNNGRWSVYPWEGDKSLLVYEIDVDPDMAIPDAIIRSAQTGSLPDVFEAVRKRVKAL